MEDMSVREQINSEMDPSMSIKSRLRSARGQMAQSDGQRTPTSGMEAAADEIPAQLQAPSTPVQWSDERETTSETVTSSDKRRQEKRYEAAEAEDIMRRSYMAAVDERDQGREEFERLVSARIRRLKEGLSPEVGQNASKPTQPMSAEPADAVSYHRRGDSYYKHDERADEQNRVTEVDVWDVPWAVIKKHGFPGDVDEAAQAEKPQTSKNPVVRGDDQRSGERAAARARVSLFQPVNQGRDALVPDQEQTVDNGTNDHQQPRDATNQGVNEAAIRDELNNTLSDFCHKMKAEFEGMMTNEREKWNTEQRKELERLRSENTRKRKVTECGDSRNSTSAVSLSAKESASVISLQKEVESLKELLLKQSQRAENDKDLLEREERRKLQHEVQQLKEQLQREKTSAVGRAEAATAKADAVAVAAVPSANAVKPVVQPYAQNIKLPKFDGRNYYSFISIFETNAKLRGWNNEEKLAWFLPCIEGEARLYLETEPDEMLSYERVKRSMEERYGNRFSTFDVKRQIRTLKRKSGESIESFADRLQSVAQSGRIDKTDKCELFYRAFLDAVEGEPKLQMYIEKEHDKNRQARLPDLLKMVREYRERSPERSVREKSMNVCQSFDKRKGPLRHGDPQVRKEVEKETERIGEEKTEKADRGHRILRSDVDYNTSEIEFLKRVIKANQLHFNLKDKEADNKEKSFNEPMGEPLTEGDWQRIRNQNRGRRDNRFGRPPRGNGGYRNSSYAGAHERDDEYSSDEDDDDAYAEGERAGQE